jgi:hypothetical protein
MTIYLIWAATTLLCHSAQKERGYRAGRIFFDPAKKDHILSDEDVRLSGFYTSQKYPKTLRVVELYDEAADQQFILDNRHHIPAI